MSQPATESAESTMQEAVSEHSRSARRRPTASARWSSCRSCVARRAAGGARACCPRDWLRVQPEEQATPMTISLGGRRAADDRRHDRASRAGPVQDETPESQTDARAAGRRRRRRWSSRRRTAKPKPPPKPVEKPPRSRRRASRPTGAEVEERRARSRRRTPRQVPFGGLPSSGGGGTGACGSTSRTSAVPNTSTTMSQTHQLELEHAPGRGRRRRW